MGNKEFKLLPRLGYKGEVRISLIEDSGRVISVRQHNAGEDALFEYLAQCLCGLNVPANYPRFLDIEELDASTNVYSSILPNGMVNTRDHRYEDDDGWCAVLSFSVNKSSVIEPHGKLRFCLYGGEYNNKKLYATVDDVKTEVITQLVPGTTLYVEWVLSVQNVTVTQS